RVVIAFTEVVELFIAGQALVETDDRVLFARVVVEEGAGGDVRACTDLGDGRRLHSHLARQRHGGTMDRVACLLLLACPQTVTHHRNCCTDCKVAKTATTLAGAALDTRCGRGFAECMAESTPQNWAAADQQLVDTLVSDDPALGAAPEAPRGARPPEIA